MCVIIICRFDAQETLIIIINVENNVFCNVFSGFFDEYRRVFKSIKNLTDPKL